MFSTAVKQTTLYAASSCCQPAQNCMYYASLQLCLLVLDIHDLYLIQNATIQINAVRVLLLFSIIDEQITWV